VAGGWDLKRNCIIRKNKLKIVSLAILLLALSWCIAENKSTLVYLFSVLFLLAFIGSIWGHIWVTINRNRGVYPKKGQESMADVKRLALNGNITLAINAYRAIKNASLKQAKKEVNKIIDTSGDGL
jgi:hypothetical protein